MSEINECDVENEGLSLIDLPFVPLMEIFSYLGVKDIRSCALSCKYLSDLSRQPALWKNLYPINWTFGCSNGSDFILPHKIKRMPNLKSRLWQVGCFMRLTTLWDIVEYNLLSRMLEHLLPVVGHGVRELHLNDSSCLHDSLLRAILVQCPNLSLLAIKRTAVTPAVFSRLADYGACRHLRNLDVSLTQVNTSSLTSLVECWTDRDDELLPLVLTEEEPLQVYHINGDDYGRKNMVRHQLVQFEQDQLTLSEDRIKRIPFPHIPCRERGKSSGLKILDLSGCPLDDLALSVLKNSRLLVENLEWLDVSGCVKLTSGAISDFVLSCPKLLAENLFYCSHINGPYAKTTNGCSKLSERSCCDKYS